LNLRVDGPVELALDGHCIYYLKMKSVALTAFPRTSGRRAGAKKLRASGRVPAVIYGRQSKPQSLEIQLKDFENVTHTAASEIILLDLTIDGEAKAKRLALVQELQHDFLSGKLLHVDLHEVAETEKVTMMIPVEAVGEAAGVRSGGGVLEHILFKIKARALPKDLPEAIKVDVTSLEIGQAIHLGDIKAPEGVELLGDKHISVLSVAAPVSEAQETAATEAAAGTAGEVEMLKEKKEEGAEGEAKAGAAGDKKAAPAAAGDKKAPAAGAEKKAEKKK
jgi:large subunit ribosomal protein L25